MPSRSLPSFPMKTWPLYSASALHLNISACTSRIHFPGFYHMLSQKTMTPGVWPCTTLALLISTCKSSSQSISYRQFNCPPSSNSSPSESFLTRVVELRDCSIPAAYLPSYSSDYPPSKPSSARSISTSLFEGDLKTAVHHHVRNRRASSPCSLWTGGMKKSL